MSGKELGKNSQRYKSYFNGMASVEPFNEMGVTGLHDKLYLKVKQQTSRALHI